MVIFLLGDSSLKRYLEFNKCTILSWHCHCQETRRDRTSLTPIHNPILKRLEFPSIPGILGTPIENPLVRHLLL